MVKLLPVLVLALLVLLPVVSAYADFYDNFDQNFANVVNPPPWTFSTTGTAGIAVSLGLIIPMYENALPTTPWTDLAGNASANPSVPIMAIINPNSGPGLNYSADFDADIATLHAAGVKVLGYVYTSWGARSIVDVEADIAQYAAWYSIDGICLDEMATVAGNESYYAAITAYAHGLGYSPVVGNPGTDTLTSYVGTVDVILNYEAAGLPTTTYLDGWHDSYAKTNWGWTAYATSFGDLNATYLTQASAHSSWMFATDATLPNPYDTLPSYLSALLALLTGIGTPTTTGGSFVGQTLASSIYAASPPNTYAISYTGTNSTPNRGEIYAMLNASSTYVVVNAYVWSKTNVSAPDWFYFILINDGNDTTWNLANVTFIDPAPSYGGYSLISTSLPVTPNGIVTIIMGVVKNTATVDYGFRSFYFDNITIQGANFDLWGSANLRLVDFDTGALFNIAAYANSRVIIGYHSGPPVVFANITSPTLNVTLTNAGLITVWVGNSYERSIIPDPYSVNTVYLNDPATVLPYQFSVVDLTQHFGVGSKIYVSYSGTAQDYIMTSGYTDAQSSFSTYLQPGSYQIQITNLTNSYTKTVTVGGATSGVTLAIIDVAVTSPGGVTESVTYGTAWNSTSVITQFTDASLSATGITWTLYQRTFAGTLAVSSYSASGSWGFWQYSFDVSSIGLNTTNAPQLFETLRITDAFGTYTLGPFPVTVPIGSIFPSNPLFYNGILGLDVILPQPNAWLNFGAAILILIVAALFTSRASPFGVLAVSVFASFFGWAGWLPIGDAAMSIIIPVAVMGIMLAKQRGTGH